MTSTRLEPTGGLHVDGIVFDHEVAAFHDLNAHPAGEKRMFEVGAVVDARGEENADGVLHFGRTEVFEGFYEPVAVNVDGANSHLLEERRIDLLHGRTIL